MPDSPDTGSDIICPPCSQQGAAAGAQAGSQAGAQAGAAAGELLPHPQGERNSINEGVRLHPPPDPPIQLQPGAARRPPMSTARHIFRDIFPSTKSRTSLNPIHRLAPSPTTLPNPTSQFVPRRPTRWNFFIPPAAGGGFTIKMLSGRWGQQGPKTRARVFCQPDPHLTPPSACPFQQPA